MLAVLIQDFRRQRRAWDAGDFSECFRPFSAMYICTCTCCWGGSWQKILCVSWLEALTLLTQVFMFLSTKGDFALVPLEVNSEEHYSVWSDGPGDLCVNAFSFWKAKFRSLHTVLYWSLLPSPHCSIPWESVPSQWYHGCMYCSIYFVLFECGHHFVFFSSPTCTGTDTLSDNCSNSLSQFCSLNCHLCIPAPHESLVQVWHYKKWLAVSYSTPHCILHWTLVSGGIMYIVKNVDVVCLRREPRGSSWKLDPVRCHRVPKQLPLVAHSMMSKISWSQWLHAHVYDPHWPHT